MKVIVRIAGVLGLVLLVAAGARAQDAAPQDGTPPALDPFAPLASSPLLRELEFHTDRTYAPVAMAVEQAPGADSERTSRLGWMLGAWSRALVRLLVSDYAGPAGAAPRAGREQFLVVTVAQARTFEALRAEAGSRDARDEQAFFAPQLPGVVVLDPGGDSEDPAVQAAVRPMLHAVTHAFLDACLAPGAPSPPAWLTEGLAERLSSHTYQLAKDEAPLRTNDVEALRALWAAFVKRPSRVAMLLPLQDLLAVGSLADLDARVSEPDMPARDVRHGFAHEASLFLAWLDESVQSKPDRARTIVRAVLAGQPCAPALAAALDGAAPAALEPDFTQWVQRKMTGMVHSSSLSDFTLQPPPLEAGEVRLGVRARPEQLAVPADDAACARALALQRAADGDLRAAAARLAELAAARGVAPADAAALQREQHLCLALDDLRHRWLVGRVGKSLDLRDGGTTLKLNLTSADGGKLVVRDKSGQRELPESACLPVTLVAALIAPGTVLPPADDDARAFAWLLVDDKAWRDKTASRIRKDSCPSAVAVLDLRPALDERLALGRALVALADLAARALPAAGAADAERDAWLAAARGVVAARALPAVADRMPVLRSLAGQVLAARFDEAPLRWSPPRAKVQDLGGGRVRVSWDFKDAAQLEDWTSGPTPPDLLNHLPPLRTEAVPTAPAIVEGGLELRGAGMSRCRLAFAAPMTVEYEARFELTPEELASRNRGVDPGDSQLVEFFVLRLCDDEVGSYLESQNFVNVYAHDEAQSDELLSKSSMARIFINFPYHLRLEHDGENLRALVEGQETARVPVLGRQAGAFVMWRYTERAILLRSLAVEGKLDTDRLGAGRSAWVDRQLADLGLGN